MLEQLLLQLFAPSGELGIVAEPAGERDEPFVDARAHRVLTVVGDLAEEAVRAVEDLAEDPLVDRLGHPPWRLLRQLRAKGLAVIVEEGHDPAEHRVEQRFLVAAVEGEVDDPADQRGNRDRLDPSASERLHGRRDSSRSSSTSRVPWMPSASAAAAAPGVLPITQPRTEAGAHLGASEALVDQFAVNISSSRRTRRATHRSGPSAWG